MSVHTLASSSLQFAFPLNTTANNWLGFIANILGIVGVAVSVAIFFRVQRISRARKDERELVSKALRLRDLNSSLTADAATLDGSASPRQQELVKSDLLKLSAELEAATRILVPGTTDGPDLSGAQLLRDGYWTDSFAADVVERINRALYVVTWRNSRVLNVGLLEGIFRQLQKHPRLEVQIYAVACDAGDETYDSMSKMLTLGSPSIMRREQQHYRDVLDDIIRQREGDGSLQRGVIDRLHYYETRVGPVMHCIVADDDAYWGINFFMNPGIGATEFLNRAYLKSDLRSEFGRKIIEQIEILRSMSSTSRYQLLLRILCISI
jgi:hypothetical protein